MTVKLNPQVKRFLEEKVEAGHFRSVDEAANELLAGVSEQERLTEADIEEIRREVAVGLEQAERGEFSELTAKEIIENERGRRD